MRTCVNVNFCNKKVKNNIPTLEFYFIMMYIDIIMQVTKTRKEYSTMRTIGADTRTKEARVRENFRFSELTEEQYIKACKQYLYAKKSDHNFEKLTTSGQETYLAEKNVLGYRFLGDRGLIEILKTFDSLTLAEIYSIIASISPRASFACGVNLDFSTLLNEKDDILIVNAEMFLNQISSICSGNKNITLWTINSFIKELLEFDYSDKKNINIELVDIYNTNNNAKKYDYILCVPQMGLKRRFERGKHYGNDASTIAAEILFKNNLSDKGTLTVIMPSKVNFSQDEVHFRQAYARNLIEVISLQDGTFRNTGIKTYLYKFTKEYSETLFISDSTDVIGEKFNISDVMSRDTTWNFEKPFKEEDEDIANLLKQEHKNLSEVADVLRGKPLSKLAQETDNNEDFTYIDLRSIKEDNIDYSETKKYTVDRDLSAEYLHDGDLLIVNKGSTSKVVLYKNIGKNCIASANLIIIRAKSAIINPEYLVIYLRSQIGQKLIKGFQRGTNMLSINHQDIKGLAVTVPSLAEQNNFVNNYKLRMDSYKKQLEQVKSSITQLEQDVNDIICGRKQDF